MFTPGRRHTATATLLALLLFTAAAWGAATPQTLPLKADWRLQSSAKVEAAGEALAQPGYDDAQWYPVEVPKTVLAALVDNGVYPDPYYGLNLKEIPGYEDGRWLVMPEDSPFRVPWWYRVEFEVPQDWKGQFADLHLDGINFQANVWLNGRQVAGSDAVHGMFRRYRFDVTAHLRYGERNALAVEIIPPGLLPEKDYDTKQVQATTGWDDHNPQPPDGNMGLWRHAFLRVHGPVALRHPYVETDLKLPELAPARLTASAFLTNYTAGTVTGLLKGRIEDRAFAEKVTLDPGETREVLLRPDDHPELVLEQPRIWWPNPLGPQELYDCAMAFVVDGDISDTATCRFGIRHITTYLNDEDWRVYEVNGRKLLIRGGAWMTSDMLLNLTARRYEALVRYAREANLNMLRSEGFSIRETETFYNLCDELGVLVTQQIFGRSIPREDIAIGCIEDMLLRIRTHPSLAHFLGHDETFPTETLDAAYRRMIEQYRVNRTYQPHSGAFNYLDRNETGGTRTGTRELWTYAGPSHYYHVRNYGAWGFAQSGGIGGIAAPRDSLEQMMPEEAWWPPLKTEAWSFHTVTQGGDYFAAVTDAMNAKYGEPDDLDAFYRRIYAMNYNSARGMYEAYGRNKYDATGITTWKYDAAWPAAMTWQYVDWYLRPTAAYYGAKKACEALHIQYAYDDEGVYVINTLNDAFTGLNASAALHAFDGSVVSTWENTVETGPDGKALAFTVERPAGLDATHFLRLTLDTAAGERVSENVYWLSTTPDMPGSSGYKLDRRFYTSPVSQADFTRLDTLPPAQLDIRAEAAVEDAAYVVKATVAAPEDKLAFLVRLDLTGEDGHALAPCYWSDNHVILMPGHARTLTARIPVAELDGKAPTLRAEGWNVAKQTAALPAP